MVDYRIYKEQTRAVRLIDDAARQCVIGTGKVSLSEFILQVQNTCKVSRAFAERTIRDTCKKYKLELQ